MKYSTLSVLQTGVGLVQQITNGLAYWSLNVVVAIIFGSVRFFPSVDVDSMESKIETFHASMNETISLSLFPLGRNSNVVWEGVFKRVWVVLTFIESSPITAVNNDHLSVV